MRISQPWHHLHFGPGNSLLWAAVLCVDVDLAASLVPAHRMAVTHLPTRPYH